MKEKIEIVIGVSVVEPETPVILQVPEEYVNFFDGLYCEDNSFYNLPKEPGIYKCQVDFEFIQGYFEGYKADGESDWSFKVTKADQILALFEDYDPDEGLELRPEVEARLKAISNKTPEGLLTDEVLKILNKNRCQDGCDCDFPKMSREISILTQQFKQESYQEAIEHVEANMQIWQSPLSKLLGSKYRVLSEEAWQALRAEIKGEKADG